MNSRPRIDSTTMTLMAYRIVQHQRCDSSVASRYNVQLILSGHEHGYERFNPTNGVHSITSARRRSALPVHRTGRRERFFWSRYNCVRFTINGDTLEAQAIGLGGEVFDSMTIQRALPPPQIYSAT
jgi:hypothetical protein